MCLLRSPWSLIQHRDPHPAIRRLDQALGEDAPGRVRLPDVMLEVQGLLRQVGEGERQPPGH